MLLNYDFSTKVITQEQFNIFGQIHKLRCHILIMCFFYTRYITTLYSFFFRSNLHFLYFLFYTCFSISVTEFFLKCFSLTTLSNMYFFSCIIICVFIEAWDSLSQFSATVFLFEIIWVQNTDTIECLRILIFKTKEKVSSKHRELSGHIGYFIYDP